LPILDRPIQHFAPCGVEWPSSTAALPSSLMRSRARRPLFRWQMHTQSAIALHGSARHSHPRRRQPPCPHCGARRCRLRHGIGEPTTAGGPEHRGKPLVHRSSTARVVDATDGCLFARPFPTRTDLGQARRPLAAWGR
jgi:hypothetical protein